MTIIRGNVSFDGPTRVWSDTHLDAADAYARWGEECVEHLHGDFAFAIWDAEQRRLFAARDRFGTSPFFYRGNLRFSSSLAELAGGALDDDAVADFLLFGASEDPAATIWRDVRRLPPAHTLVATPEGVRVARYWQLPDEPGPPPDGDVVEQFRELLQRAIDERTRGADRVSIAMSGGTDSTSIAALTHAALHALTLDFPGSEEPAFAALAAQAIGATHEIINGEIAPYDRWQRGASFLGEPLDDPTYAAWIDLLRAAARHAPILLTGFGGDPALTATPARWHRLFRPHHAPPFPQWLDRDFVREHDLEERWRAHFAPASPRERLERPGWSQLFDTFHEAATGVAIDVAHPFLDDRLLEFLLRLPRSPWLDDKYILREAMRGRLPEEVRRRPKAFAPDSGALERFFARRGEWLALIDSQPYAARYIDVAGFAAAEPDDRWTQPVSFARWLSTTRA